MVGAVLALTALAGCTPAPAPSPDPTATATPTGTETTRGLWIELPADADARQIEAGITTDGRRWSDLSAQSGAVRIRIAQESWQPAATDDQVRQLVTAAIGGVSVSSWSIEPDPSATETLSHPTRSFRFTAGESDGIRAFEGLYIDTDEGGLSVTVGFSSGADSDLQATVRGWVSDLSIVEA